MSETVRAVAAGLKKAFETNDLALLGRLLDPEVRWGGEEETPETCRSRSDVLSWYGRLNSAGVRARVTEMIVRDHAVVLALGVTGRERDLGDASPDLVFQVFRIAAGKVVDIHGYPQRALALHAADSPAAEPD